jgi:hypothetical protein
MSLTTELCTHVGIAHVSGRLYNGEHNVDVTKVPPNTGEEAEEQREVAEA